MVRFRACVPRRMASDFSGFRARPLCRNQDESDMSADSRLVKPGSDVAAAAPAALPLLLPAAAADVAAAASAATFAVSQNATAKCRP